MAYIGAEPVPGQNREVDDISSSFNGSTTAFTLQVSGVNVSPESANNILVNLGGVLQNPGTDYTIAASTITFTTAPASGLSFFALVLGAGINTATVADDTIGASKLIDTAVTAGSYTTADITVDAQGRITAAANGTIATAEIADGAVNNAKVNASAAIAGTKISPDFGSQNIVTTGSISGAAGTLTGDLTIPDTIVHTGDTNTKIRFPAADTVSIETGGSERLRIDSSGRLQQGSDTSNLGSAKLNIVTGGEDGISIGKNATGTVSSGDVLGTYAFQNSIGTQTTNSAEASIKAIAAQDSTGSTAATDLAFFTKPSGTGPGSSPTERLRISSSGDIGIGTTSPASSFVLSKGGGSTQIELNRTDTNTTGNVGVIKFTANDGHVVASMGAYGDGDNEGAYINFKVTSAASGTNPFTTTSEALRIKSDKNIEISDGDLAFASGHGISFGATSDASGAVSELFDDYEEGTWTPSSNGGYTSASSGSYTKIGKMVYAVFSIDISSNSDSGHATIQGLPYAAENVDPNANGVAPDYQTYDVEDGPIYHIGKTQTQIVLYKNAGAALQHQNISGKNLRGTAIYRT